MPKGLPGILLFLVLSFLAVKMGMIAGDALLAADFRVVQKIDVEYFKNALNNALPLIDEVYNSGNISVSFTSEVKKLVKGIFGFDLSTPISILNCQSSVFYSYYQQGYLPKLAQKGEEPSRKEEPQEPQKAQEQPGEQPEQTIPKEAASSISYEEDHDQHEMKEEQLVKNGKGSLALNNETKFKVSLDELIKGPLKIKLDKKGPKVLIYHTHTSESYLQDAKQIGKTGIPNWSRDPEKSVVRVGEELAQTLRKKYGIEVIHNGTVHDYPNYNGAYNRSMDTASKILKSYPSIKVVIDLHRDGIGVEGKKLRAVTKVEGKNVAQVMFVVGSSQNLAHPNWRENLKFALKLQDKLNAISPSLAKPIDLSYNRYNQHLSTGAIIIEVGGDGNLLSESIESTKYLARVIDEVLNGK